MRLRNGKPPFLPNFGLAAAVLPALLLVPGKETGALLGAASFWLTVALAAVGSVLSAFCIYDPVAEPKRDPYSFMGQWFLWLVTPLLWGTVAASLTLAWLKPFDLAAVLAAGGMGRWGAQAVCSVKWRKREPRHVSYLSYATRPQRHW